MCTRVGALILLFIGLTSAYCNEYHQQKQKLPNGANLAQNENQQKVEDLAKDDQQQAALKKIKKAEALNEGDSAKDQIEEWKALEPFKFAKTKVQKSVPVVLLGYKLIQDEEPGGERKEEGKGDDQSQQQDLSPKQKLEEEKKLTNEQLPPYDEKKLAEFYKWYTR